MGFDPGKAPPVPGRVRPAPGRTHPVLGKVRPVLGRSPPVLGEVPSVCGRTPPVPGRRRFVPGKVPSVCGPAPHGCGRMSARRRRIASGAGPFIVISSRLRPTHPPPPLRKSSLFPPQLWQEYPLRRSARSAGANSGVMFWELFTTFWVRCYFARRYYLCQ